MDTEEKICPWCKQYFTPKNKRHRFCSPECRKEYRHEAQSNWTKRLNDGMRLLSDDFGEQDGDDGVTYQ